MAGFAITSCLGATSLSAAPRKGQEIRRISYYDLVPSEDNFYSMDEIAALKASIELAGHVLHIYDKEKNEISRRASNRKVMQKHGKLSRVNMPGSTC